MGFFSQGVGIVEGWDYFLDKDDYMGGCLDADPLAVAAAALEGIAAGM